MARKRASNLSGPLVDGNRGNTACSAQTAHGACANTAPFSHGTLGGGPWYCDQHFLGERAVVATTQAIAVQTRRNFWRGNTRLQRHVSEQDFVGRGYDRALLEALGAPVGLAAKPRTYQREPGEDLFHEEETP